MFRVGLGFIYMVCLGDCLGLSSENARKAENGGEAEQQRSRKANKQGKAEKQRTGDTEIQEKKLNREKK